jgi:hypothetical protein
MEWLIPAWMYWLAAGSAPDPRYWTMDDEAGPRRYPELTALDLTVVRLVYGVVAAQSRCARCGAGLRRDVRVTSVACDCPQRTALVETVCGGWRRHRHVARVDEASNDLLVGPFRPY